MRQLVQLVKLFIGNSIHMNKLHLILVLILGYNVSFQHYPFYFPYSYMLDVEVIEKSNLHQITTYSISFPTKEELVISHLEYFNKQIILREKEIAVAIDVIKSNESGKVVSRYSGNDNISGSRYYYQKTVTKKITSEAKAFFKKHEYILIVKRVPIGIKQKISIDSIYFKK